MNLKKYIKIIIPIIIIVLCLIIGTGIYLKRNKNIGEESTTMELNTTELSLTENDISENMSDVMVVGIEEKNTIKDQTEEKRETKEKPKTKSAAEITQEIYAINGPVGKIKIPSTKVNLTILSNVTVDNMEKSPCFLYTTGGINETGTTLIVGHNKRNGKLFSNNAKIKKGDKIYITDLNKKTLTYKVYDKVVTTDDDTSFLRNNVDKPEIVLSSCTDDESKRIIILAKAD